MLLDGLQLTGPQHALLRPPAVAPGAGRRALAVALAGPRHHQPLPGDPSDGDTVERLHISTGHARRQDADVAP